MRSGLLVAIAEQPTPNIYGMFMSCTEEPGLHPGYKHHIRTGPLKAMEVLLKCQFNLMNEYSPKRKW